MYSKEMSLFHPYYSMLSYDALDQLLSHYGHSPHIYSVPAEPDIYGDSWMRQTVPLCLCLAKINCDTQNFPIARVNALTTVMMTYDTISQSPVSKVNSTTDRVGGSLVPRLLCGPTHENLGTRGQSNSNCYT